MKLKNKDIINIGKWTMSKKEAELINNFNKNREEVLECSHITLMEFLNLYNGYRPYEVKRR